MANSPSGSIPLFRVAGIRVYLHWAWFIMAWIMVWPYAPNYTRMGWAFAGYAGLFLIVLLHEFGHAFATRQTGGKADEILLWPFGGVAYVQPTPRPAAHLWAIAAGPLVNVALIPVIFGLMWLRRATGFTAEIPAAREFLIDLHDINLRLLIFNMLPLYPLDGGQILRSLLWFKLGQARSLYVATIISFVGIPALGFWAYTQNPGQWIWILVMGGYILQGCIQSFKHAQALLALEKRPRHRGFACPSCHQAPPGGPIWRCSQCGNGFDPFSTRAVCPHCQTAQEATLCPHCGTASPIARWTTTRWDDGLPPVKEV